MKKGWKIFWIVCAVCIGIGFVCCALSMALGVTVDAVRERFPYGINLADGVGIYFGDETDAKGIASVEGDKVQSFRGVSSIDVEVNAVEVRFEQSEQSDVCTVETENIDERLKLKCYQEGDELKITTRKKIAGINNSSVGQLTIYVPQDCTLQDASFEVGAGTLYVDNIRAQEFSVSVGAGEVTIDNFTAQEADFECGAGAITAAGDVGHEVDIECGIGQIAFTAAGKQTDYNYEIDCGIGQIQCGESSYSGVMADKAIHNGAAREMNIECGIGQITIYFTENI